MFSRYVAQRRQGIVVRVERGVERLPGDAAEADVGGVGEAAADPPLELGRFARAHESDDDRLLARGLQLMGERDRLERAVGEILDSHPPERVVVEQAGCGGRVLLEPRLGGRRVGERVGASAEPGVDQDPAPAGDVEAGVRASDERRPRLGLRPARCAVPRSRAPARCRPPSPRARSATTRSRPASCRERSTFHVRAPTLVSLPRRLASGWPQQPAIASAISSRPAMKLSSGSLEHVGRRGAEADGRVAGRHAALLEVVVLPRELVVVVADERRGDPAVAAAVDEARVVLDEPLDDLLVEIAPAEGVLRAVRLVAHLGPPCQELG